MAGFNWGAKRYDRVEESYRFSSRLAFIGGGIMALLLALYADQLIVLFAGQDLEMRKIGAFSIITQCIAMPLHAWVAIVNMYCVGLGNAKGALALSTARQGTCFIPFVHLLAGMFGAYGVASVQGVADVLSLILAIPIIISMKKKVKQAMLEQAKQ